MDLPVTAEDLIADPQRTDRGPARRRRDSRRELLGFSATGRAGAYEQRQRVTIGRGHRGNPSRLAVVLGESEHRGRRTVADGRQRGHPRGGDHVGGQVVEVGAGGDRRAQHRLRPRPPLAAGHWGETNPCGGADLGDVVAPLPHSGERYDHGRVDEGGRAARCVQALHLGQLGDRLFLLGAAERPVTGVGPLGQVVEELLAVPAQLAPGHRRRLAQPADRHGGGPHRDQVGAPGGGGVVLGEAEERDEEILDRAEGQAGVVAHRLEVLTRALAQASRSPSRVGRGEHVEVIQVLQIDYLRGPSIVPPRVRNADLLLGGDPHPDPGADRVEGLDVGS